MQGIIQSKDFNTLIDLVKASKQSHFRAFIDTEGVITCVQGTNEHFSYICDINLEYSVNPIQCIFFTAEQLLRDTMLTSIPTDCFYYNDLYITNNKKSDFIRINAGIPDKFIDSTIKFNYLNDFKLSKTQNVPFIDFGDISDNPSIIQMQSNTVTSGVIPFVIGNYLMTIYKGIVPMNKADKLSLRVFPFDEDNRRFCSEFTLVKKKKITFKFYYFFLNLM